MPEGASPFRDQLEGDDVPKRARPQQQSWARSAQALDPMRSLSCWRFLAMEPIPFRICLSV